MENTASPFFFNHQKAQTAGDPAAQGPSLGIPVRPSGNPRKERDEHHGDSDAPGGKLGKGQLDHDPLEISTAVQPPCFEPPSTLNCRSQASAAAPLFSSFWEKSVVTRNTRPSGS